MNIIEVDEKLSGPSWVCLKKEKRGSDDEMAVDREGRVVVVVEASSTISEEILIF